MTCLTCRQSISNGIARGNLSTAISLWETRGQSSTSPVYPNGSMADEQVRGAFTLVNQIIFGGSLPELRHCVVRDDFHEACLESLEDGTLLLQMPSGWTMDRQYEIMMQLMIMSNGPFDI